MMLTEEISRLIRSRRSIYPKSYLPGQPVERELIEQLLENANWAPTHKLTEPWRLALEPKGDPRHRAHSLQTGRCE